MIGSASVVIANNARNIGCDVLMLILGFAVATIAIVAIVYEVVYGKKGKKP